MTKLMKPSETPTPINEAAINPKFVEAIRRAKQSGPVMTPDEFMAWLDQHIGNASA